MSVSSNRLDESFRKLLQEEVAFDDEIESPIDDDEEFSTTSIRVLVVDADSNSLSFMKNLMTQFSCQVTNYESGEEAISFLKKSKHEIDLVIWDFHMPDMNGLDALNTIVKEMYLPVVIMSNDHRKETVMKSIKYGACDFLVKPVSKEVVAVLWQHVFRKRIAKSGLDKPDRSDMVESDSDGDELYQSNEEGSKNNSDQKGDKSPSKKSRMTWTAELHHKFEVAVAKIGSLENAFPKQILKLMQEEMNVQGLTRNNVASHLQKYRLNNIKNTRTETQEDIGWRNAGHNTVSNPLLNSGINLHARGSYQAAVNAPIQYPPSSYMPMNNNNDFITNNMPFFENFQLPQQQYYSSLQLPSVLSKQEHGHMSSSAMENSGQLIYNTSLPYEHNEYFPTGNWSI
ncbi:putative two-component response regulator ARR20 [Cardamine amara subsp. amara]|uniref:Two-component response regulator ARR20 n=1 Tax=Cardamine amara subsp. amara TaxID=228776 RepID=A0ABD1BGG1_CARAN